MQFNTPGRGKRLAITNKDIEKMKEVFVTKEDLKKELQKFATKDDLRNFATKDEVLTRLDKIMGELEKAREDRIFAKAKDDEQDKKIDSLDLRVKKIEVKVG